MDQLYRVLENDDVMSIWEKIIVIKVLNFD